MLPNSSKLADFSTEFDRRKITATSFLNRLQHIDRETEHPTGIRIIFKVQLNVCVFIKIDQRFQKLPENSLVTL